MDIKSVLIAITFFLFISNCLKANTPYPDVSPDVLERIRTDFYRSIEDGDVIDELTSFIQTRYSENTENYPAVILAYYGGLETLKAKHSYNPVNKFRYVISGLKILSKAVEKSPSLLEVRFLRFSVLHFIPGVFGISDEREDDMKHVYSALVKKDYSLVDRNLQKGVAEFLVKSSRLSPTEIHTLKIIFPDLEY